MKTAGIALYENRIFRIVILTVLGLLAALSVMQGARNALRFSQDFQWDAAKALMMRIDPYDESLSPTGALDRGDLQAYYSYYESIGAPQKMEANQFPSLLLLLFPYTLFSPHTARILWLVTNILYTAGLAILFRKTFLAGADRFLYALLILLMLAGTPYRNQLGVGQHTVFSLFYLLLAVYLVQKNAGCIPVSLALAVSYFKYTLTAPLALYFVYKRKWRELVLSVGIHAALTGVSARWLSESYFDMLLKPLKVSMALASEGGLDFGALFHGSTFAFILAAIVMCGLFIVSLKADGTQENLLFSVLLLWSLIILYHRTYDFFPLILVSSVFFAAAGNGIRGRMITLPAYIAVLLLVFFVMRLFGEATFIRIVTGTVYYAFTLWMTALLNLSIFKTGNTDNGNG
ncbi:MAG: DUF2029 domain-containing protein [Lachnospiraceae bacterium]|nr:DUF2029 domain-containing protein [Lachnospiraceae bacterium]